MPVLQFKRGTQTEVNNYIGEPGEITVITDDNYRLVVHDGTTSGGHPLAFESEIGQAGSTAIAQWDAQALSLTDGDRITSWPDRVGSFDLADGAGLDYVASGINGYPSALSNGTDDNLGLNSFGTSLTQPYSISGVAQMQTQDGTDQQLIGFLNSSDQAAGAVWGDRSTGNRIIFAGSTLSDGAADTTVIAFVAVFDGASSVFNVDGSESSGDAGTREIANNNMRIGSSGDGLVGFADALHGEYVLHDTVLDSTQRSDEISRLQDKWT